MGPKRVDMEMLCGARISVNTPRFEAHVDEHPKVDTEVMGGGDDALLKMFPQRSTEEVVAEIVASDPRRHGVPVAERLRMAREAAAGGDYNAWEVFYRGRVIEIGGDPDAMQPGNKPRYTVDEETGDVKDHDTGEVHKGHQASASTDAAGGGDAQGVPGGAQEDAQAVGGREVDAPGHGAAGGAPVDAEPADGAHAEPDRHDAQPAAPGDVGAPGGAQDPATCEHVWPSENPADADECAKCYITFKAWANS